MFADVFRPQWPDAIDATAVAAFVALAVSLPVLGYVLVAIDFRRYLRSLRRAISCIVYRDTGTPAWVQERVPRCVAALGLEWPCSEDQLKDAYRQKVKSLHPDRGGDPRRFQLVQAYFEEALRLVRERERSKSL
jgi:hypothetical protein